MMILVGGRFEAPNDERSGRRWKASIVTIFGALLLMLSAFAGTARAAAYPTVALHVEGKSHDAAHAAIAARLPKDGKVIEGADVDAALKAAGVKLPVGVAITEERSRGQLVKPLRKAAGRLSADLAVLARAQTDERAFVLIVDAKDGHVVFQGALDLSDKQAKGLVAAFAPYGGSESSAPDAAAPDADAEPPSKPKPAADAPSPPADAPPSDAADTASDSAKDTPSSSRKRNEVATELFELGVGFEFAGRTFSYSNPLPNATNLRPYSVIGFPMLAVNGALFPFAGMKTPVVRDIGIAFDFGRAFAVKAENAATQVTLTSTYTRWDVALRGRIRTGGATAPLIGLMAGAGGVIFSTASPPANFQGGLPDVNMKFFRAAADVRIPVSRAFLALGIGYKRALGQDEVYARFRSASVNAVDAHVGVGVRIVDGLDARLAADYDRFFSSFSPKVGDPYVAGGALDQYLGLTLGLAYVF